VAGGRERWEDSLLAYVLAPGRHSPVALNAARLGLLGGCAFTIPRSITGETSLEQTAAWQRHGGRNTYRRPKTPPLQPHGRLFTTYHRPTTSPRAVHCDYSPLAHTFALRAVPPPATRAARPSPPSCARRYTTPPPLPLNHLTHQPPHAAHRCLFARCPRFPIKPLLLARCTLLCTIRALRTAPQHCLVARPKHLPRAASLLTRQRGHARTGWHCLSQPHGTTCLARRFGTLLHALPGRAAPGGGTHCWALQATYAYPLPRLLGTPLPCLAPLVWRKTSIQLAEQIYHRRREGRKEEGRRKEETVWRQDWGLSNLMPGRTSFRQTARLPLRTTPLLLAPPCHFLALTTSCLTILQRAARLRAPPFWRCLYCLPPHLTSCRASLPGTCLPLHSTLLPPAAAKRACRNSFSPSTAPRHYLNSRHDIPPSVPWRRWAQTTATNNVGRYGRTSTGVACRRGTCCAATSMTSPGAAVKFPAYRRWALPERTRMQPLGTPSMRDGIPVRRCWHAGIAANRIPTTIITAATSAVAVTLRLVDTLQARQNTPTPAFCDCALRTLHASLCGARLLPATALPPTPPTFTTTTTRLPPLHPAPPAAAPTPAPPYPHMKTATPAHTGRRLPFAAPFWH